ncbi:cytochrome ubiquinol oxidase subunit I, partial [Mycobacterium sp.]|uniref:cytochrome ubiquinol oxidase subunit I n=1 Tax=Mycobacterium sp. TaxID=1785 RepID=UPI003C765D0F
MNVVDISRWQFGITTIYHFIFVPLTIGLAPLLAVMQTVWVVTGNTAWYRLTKFFGKLFLINFAIGVATGIVQEFQFGMNWSEYSRFVGDIFGAPLAMEGLLAFFFESTFIGLWIFGWTRLPRLVHLACIWIVAIGVNVSAFFIIVANSFMQHPVGAHYNPETRRAELNSIVALLTNNTAR